MHCYYPITCQAEVHKLQYIESDLHSVSHSYIILPRTAEYYENQIAGLSLLRRNINGSRQAP
jgi:hypothetical protein